MRSRLTLVILALFAAGCGAGGPATPTAPAPAPNAQKLPPEVEFDPATAAEKYKSKYRKP